MKDRKGAHNSKDDRKGRKTIRGSSPTDAARKPRKEARDFFEDAKVGKIKPLSKKDRSQSCQSTPRQARTSFHTGMPQRSISVTLTSLEIADCLKDSAKCLFKEAPKKRVRFDEESIERANALNFERIRQDAAEDAKRNPPGVLMAQFSALNELTSRFERL
ncbi:MAG: hypothetical protein Q9160_001771 [Pyrenula sp. 1 TL-2023]